MATTAEIPTAFEIGTRAAFAAGEEYPYSWMENLSIFICDKTTSDGLIGEKLGIMIGSSSEGDFYLAVEGTYSPSSGFVSRRPAFRTQAKLWIAGWHKWQTNLKEDGGDAQWDIRDHGELNAETKVAADATFIFAQI